MRLVAQNKTRLGSLWDPPDAHSTRSTVRFRDRHTQSIYYGAYSTKSHHTGLLGIAARANSVWQL